MKRLIFAIVFLVIPFLLMSCDSFQLRNRVYTGSKLVEFYPPEGATVDEADEASEVVTVKPKINFISPEGLAKQDLKIKFVVDDSSTAVAGQDYNIVTGSPVTIAKGKASTHMQVDIMADHLKPGQVRVLFISLRGNDIFKPAFNYKTFRIIIRGEKEDSDSK